MIFIYKLQIQTQLQIILDSSKLQSHNQLLDYKIYLVNDLTTILMKTQHENILQIFYQDKKYYYSLIQKQNQSGFRYNQRILFLLPHQFIGYLSDSNIEQTIDFSKYKAKILITNIKTMILQNNILKIKYFQIVEKHKLQKQWVIRMRDQKMAQKWMDKIRQEKIQLKNKQLALRQSAIIKQSSFMSYSPKSKSFDISPQSKISKKIIYNHTKTKESRLKITPNQSYSLIPNKQALRDESKELGIVMSPRNILIQPIQTKSIGIGVSTNNFVIPHQQSSVFNNKAQFGTNMSKKSLQDKIQKQTKQIGTSISVKQYQTQNQVKLTELVKNNHINNEDFNNVNATDSNEITQQSLLPDILIQNSIKQQKANNPLTNEPQITNPYSFKKNRYPSQIKYDRKHQTSLNKEKFAQNKVNGKLIITQNINLTQVSNCSFQESITQPIVLVHLNNHLQSQNQQKSSFVANNHDHKNINAQSNKKVIKKQVGYFELTQKIIQSSRKVPSSKQFQSKSSNKFHSLKQQPQYVERQDFAEHLEVNRMLNFTEIKARAPNQQNKLAISQQSQQSQIHKIIILKPVINQQQKPSQTSKINNILSNNKLMQNQIKSISYNRKQNKTNFSSYQPQFSWIVKYLNYKEQMFEQFKQYTTQLLQQLIQDHSLSPGKRKYRAVLTKDNIQYFRMEDLQIKFSILDFYDNSRVCNKASIKLLQNQFNNYQILYQHIPKDGKLQVPLLCLTELNGFIALFKLSPKCKHISQQPFKLEDFTEQFKNLDSHSKKFGRNLSQKLLKYVVQLDDVYSPWLLNDNKQIKNFIFFIQQIEQQTSFINNFFTYQDKLDDFSLIRKQLNGKQPQNFVFSNIDRSNIQRKKISQNKKFNRIEKSIAQSLNKVVNQLNSLQIYFANSTDLSSYFHQNGINMHYLGFIYKKLISQFQKAILMSQMASRCCKILFRKKLQDIIKEQQLPYPIMINKMYNFLNLIISTSQQAQSLWNILSQHSRHYFDCELNVNKIDKGFFLISLVQQCNIQINWQQFYPQLAFQSLNKKSECFNVKNMNGIRAKCKIYKPFHNIKYEQIQEILNERQNEGNFQSLLRILQIDQQNLPDYIKILQTRIQKYVSFFVSPSQSNGPFFKNLSIYPVNYFNSTPSLHLFNLLLIQLKWAMKQQNNHNYLKIYHTYAKLTQKYYGQYHPLYSQLYDILSIFLLQNNQFQEAIKFNKSSLINVLRICGVRNQKTADSYYNLAVSYIKAKSYFEAIDQLNKAKNIYQNLNRQSSFEYALIMNKYALIYLNLQQIEQSLAYSTSALTILQRQTVQKSQDELIQCYNIIIQCYQFKKSSYKITQITYSLDKIIKNISKPNNLGKCLTVYISCLFEQIPSQNISCYVSIISQLSQISSKHMQNQAFMCLKERIKQESLFSNFKNYLKNIMAIDNFISKEGLMEQWKSFEEIYERQTVKDFISLTQQLIIVIGQIALNGILEKKINQAS